MLVKTLHFDDEVLAVLRGMTWTEEGRVGVIGRQLDRKLYARVDKALVAMGGKWNRGRVGHVFVEDPRPRVEGLLESGTLEVARDGFFETPLAVIERMLALLPVYTHGDTLEPSAGKGAIARVLRGKLSSPDLLLCIEKNEARAEDLRKQLFYTRCQDFLDYTFQGWFRIYMNPPFEEGQDMDHVRHAYDLLAYNGALVSVMGEHAFFASNRKSAEFREWLERVDAKTYPLPDRSFHESGTDVATRLVVIERNGGQDED